jgi:hypothetical protein
MPPGPAPSRTTAQYVKNVQIAIRVGDSSRGACYTLTDVGGEGKFYDTDSLKYGLEIERWANNPSKAKYHPKWVNRLWNCCVMMHALSGGAGTVHFLRGAKPTAERYAVGGHDAVGDGFTFAKSNFGSAAAPGANTIDMTRHDVQWLYDQIMEELDRLASA